MRSIKRVWHWISPAVIGTLTLALMSEIGNKSFSAWLLIPSAVLGTLIGYTVRGVKRLRPLLGTATTWVAAATLWGSIAFVTVTLPPKCPVEFHEGRCSVQEASIWGVNAALVVVLMMLAIEPPKVLVRIWRAWRSRVMSRRNNAASKSPKTTKSPKTQKTRKTAQKRSATKRKRK
jgi:hypothetical protein